MICLSVTCDCVLVGDLMVIVSPPGCAASGGKRKFGVLPVAFHPPKYFVTMALASAGVTSPTTAIVVRSGRYANAYHLRTSPGAMRAMLATLASRRRGSPGAYNACVSARLAC